MAAHGRSPPGTWRLLAPALAGWGVTACAIARPGSAALIAASAGAAGALGSTVLLVRGWRRRPRRDGQPGPESRHPAGRLTGVLLIVCAVVMLLGARVAFGEQARADPTLAAAADRGDSVDFEARLSGFPESRVSPFGERHWVRAEARMPTGTVPMLLWLDDGVSRTWAPGLRIGVHGRLERLGAGDSAAYAVDVVSLRVSEAQSRGIGSAAARAAALLRNGLREAAKRTPGAELVPGLAVGDTALVTDELDRAMLESSLTHLTAVSGANCALVTGAVLWLLARLGAPRRGRLALAALALAAFVALVGPDASVRRAAIMAAVLLASGFGGKRAAALPALALAVLVLLAADPWQALQPGFALSVAATGGILLMAAPIGHWLSRRARLPRLLALPIAVALAAQLACGPLLLLLQPGVPAVGVLANVVAAPAAPLGTGLGLLAALTAPLPAGITEAFVLAASLPARWIAATAHFAAGLPGGRWHWPEGWPGALLLAGCQLGLLTAWALHRGHLSLPALGARPGSRVEPRKPWSPAVPAPRPIRMATALLVCACSGVFIGVAIALPAAEQLGVPRAWAVVACDIGQGDAVLLRDPAHPGDVILVDTGDEPELLGRCLDRFGVHRITLLVLSHDDRDHVGALGTIVDRVDSALISPTVAGVLTQDREVVRELERAEVPYRIGQAGDERPASSPGPGWRVIAPGATEPADSNAASLVMLVDAGPARVLMLADTGLDEQQALLGATVEHTGQSELHADVLKVAHHGSRDQDPRLPAAVHASWALVSVGAENGYGHPASETLASLGRSGTRVLRTDRMGSIALVPAPGGRLEPWVERSGTE